MKRIRGPGGALNQPPPEGGGVDSSSRSSSSASSSFNLIFLPMKDIKNDLNLLAETNAYANQVFNEIMRQFSDMNPEQISLLLGNILLFNYAAFGATALTVGIIVVLRRRRAQVVDGDVNVDGEPLGRELERGMDNLNETVSDATDFIDRTVELIEGQDGNIAPEDLSSINRVGGILGDLRRNLDEIAVLTEGVSSRGLGDFRTILADFLDSYEAFLSIFNAL